MPVKWKIFLALNFILSLPALVCLILLVISFLNSHRRNYDYFLPYLLLSGMLLITINGFLNIYIMQRFFPDKLLPAGIKSLNILSVLLNILISIGIMIVCIYGASEELGRHNYERDASGKIALTIIFVLWLVQVVVLIMQVQLPGLISRNNQERMDSLIDSIGQ